MKKTISIIVILTCILFGILISSGFWRNYTIAQLCSFANNHKQTIFYLNKASKVQDDYIFPSFHYSAAFQLINTIEVDDLVSDASYSDTLLQLMNDNDPKLQSMFPKAIELLQKHGLNLLKSNKNKDAFFKYIEKIKGAKKESSLPYYLKGKYYFGKKNYQKNYQN